LLLKVVLDAMGSAEEEERREGDSQWNRWGMISV
jgi:hypothetical protein